MRALPIVALCIVGTGCTYGEPMFVEPGDKIVLEPGGYVWTSKGEADRYACGSPASVRAPVCDGYSTWSLRCRCP